MVTAMQRYEELVNKLISARMEPSWHGLPGALQIAVAALCAYLAGAA